MPDAMLDTEVYEVGKADTAVPCANIHAYVNEEKTRT